MAEDDDATPWKAEWIAAAVCYKLTGRYPRFSYPWSYGKLSPEFKEGLEEGWNAYSPGTYRRPKYTRDRGDGYAKGWDLHEAKDRRDASR